MSGNNFLFILSSLMLTICLLLGCRLCSFQAAEGWNTGLHSCPAHSVCSLPPELGLGEWAPCLQEESAEQRSVQELHKELSRLCSIRDVNKKASCSLTPCRFTSLSPRLYWKRGRQSLCISCWEMETSLIEAWELVTWHQRVHVQWIGGFQHEVTRQWSHWDHRDVVI